MGVGLLVEFPKDLSLLGKSTEVYTLESTVKKEGEEEEKPSFSAHPARPRRQRMGGGGQMLSASPPSRLEEGAVVVGKLAACFVEEGHCLVRFLGSFRIKGKPHKERSTLTVKAGVEHWLHSLRW